MQLCSFNGASGFILARPLGRGLKVRIGHGIHLQTLVEGLRRGKIVIPIGMMSDLFAVDITKTEMPRSQELADRILGMLRSPHCGIEVCVNSNLVLLKGTRAARHSLLRKYLKWLTANTVNFYFGADDSGIHGGMSWLKEVQGLCNHRADEFCRDSRSWYAEWLVLHLVHAFSKEDCLSARQRSIMAVFYKHC